MLQIGLPQIHDSNVDQDKINPLEAFVLFSDSPPSQRDTTSSAKYLHILPSWSLSHVIRIYSFCSYSSAVNTNFPLNGILGWQS
jgi:hypothetical protein